MDVLSAVASFAVVAGLLTLVPGLDTALVLRSAAAHGRANAFATAVGISSGALIWGAAAAGGATALLTASETAYPALRVEGLAWFTLLILGVERLGALLRRLRVKRSTAQRSLDAVSWMR